MTRLQTILLLVLIFVAAAVLAQSDVVRLFSLAATFATVIAWIGHVVSLFVSIPAFISAFPSWVWWMIFGVLMTAWCSRKAGRHGGGCCGSRRRRWEAT